MPDFVFSSSMISTLTTELTYLNAHLGTPDAGATAYEDILSDISQLEIVYGGESSTAEEVPALNVDSAVWDYFNGAVEINQNEGAAGQFVNDYTLDEYKIRDPNGSFTQSDFSYDSNEIAASVGWVSEA